MNYHINYAHNRFLESQIKNSETSLNVGKFDKSIKYGINDIDENFKSKNKKILDEKKGAGYWLWKPYIIKKTLSEVDYDDIIFYTDSGCYFIKSMENLFEAVKTNKDGIILQELDDRYQNKNWTKRDCFFYMNLDREPFLSKTMIIGGFILLRKNNFVIDFIDEWISLSEDYRLITDAKNECGLDNYDGYISHRHDQSILSLMCVKNNICTIQDISQFGNNRRNHEEQIIQLTRY